MDRELEIEHRLTKVEESCALLPKMSEQLDELEKKFIKYDGRWGTITLLGAGLWAVVVVFKDNILNLFKG
jgi:hypothetical protein